MASQADFPKDKGNIPFFFEKPLRKEKAPCFFTLDGYMCLQNGEEGKEKKINKTGTKGEDP